MRHSLILAGGSGTRLWPMSRKERPKQLIPFIGGKSLIEIAYRRLDLLVPPERRYICAGNSHEAAIMNALDDFSSKQFIGEPVGRDTLNALALSSAVISRDDPDAVIAVFTADHVIEPVDRFRSLVDQAFSIVEDSKNTLMTFGITPTHPATGYGYLELGRDFASGSSIVNRFREKPDGPTAASYFEAGSERYLWNSGMFVWKASVFLDCVRRFEPDVFAGIERIIAEDAIAEVYPTLKKISVDFAVMEPASVDPDITVAALPMPLSWLDVGSWPQFAQTLPADDTGNTVSGAQFTSIGSEGILAASDDENHLITAIGCKDLIIVHTENATLICSKDEAEKIKELYGKVEEEFGPGYV